MTRTADILGNGFLSENLGPFKIGGADVFATLVSKHNPESRKAFFYIHGYNDYFYQEHFADYLVAAGYNFYALDLHFSGRSLRSGQSPHYCKDIKDYYPEITAALQVIREQDKNEIVVGNFHSTGATIGLLYAQDHQDTNCFQALILTSPFLRFNVTWINEEVMIKLIASLGSIFPETALPGGLARLYGESLHKDFHGEWNYRLDWKPIEGFPTRAGWIRSINTAQQRIQQGLNLNCPILSMFSSASSHPKAFEPIAQQTDTVLNVLDIARYSMTLGNDMTLKPIPGGMHDLVLSPLPVRNLVFKEMTAWLGYKNL